MCDLILSLSSFCSCIFGLLADHSKLEFVGSVESIEYVGYKTLPKNAPVRYWVKQGCTDIFFCTLVYHSSRFFFFFSLSLSLPQ